MSRDTLELFSSPEFLTGLRLGIVSLLGGAGIAFLWRRRPAPLGGLLLAGAVLVGIPVAHLVPAGLWLAIGLLIVGGSLVPLLPARWVTAPLVVLPGALMVAFLGDLPGDPWIRWFVAGAIVACSPLVISFDRRHDGLAPPLLAISVVGIFFTLPDTEEALVLLGVSLPLAVLGRPMPLASLGSGGAAAAIGAILWIIALGGYGRAGAIVGGTAALGLLLAEPVGRVLARTRTTILDQIGSVSAAFSQLVVVFIASRVAGLQQSADQAALIAVPLLLAAAAIVGLLGSRSVSDRLPGWRRPDQSPDHPPSSGSDQAGQKHPPGSL